MCSGGWCIDKLGVFHAGQISMCFDPHVSCRVGWRHEIDLSHPVRYFADRSKAVLLLWIFCVFFCLVFVVPLCASVCLCLVVSC